MDEGFIKQKMEDLGMKPEVVDEFLLVLKEEERKQAERSPDKARAEEAMIDEALLAETDWRKRAALSAKKISLHLEE